MAKKTKQEKEEMHREIVREYRGFLLIADVMIIFVLLMNIGAVVMTNFLVAATEPDLKFVEANPVQAENFGFETTEEAQKKYHGWIIQMLLYFALLLLYFYARLTFYTKTQFIVFIASITFVFYVIAWDFWNDLAFVLGRRLCS